MMYRALGGSRQTPHWLGFSPISIYASLASRLVMKYTDIIYSFKLCTVLSKLRLALDIVELLERHAHHARLGTPHFIS